jgi:hypothetical protein
MSHETRVNSHATKLELLAPRVGQDASSASPEEAAAILIALELFIRDTTPAAVGAPGAVAGGWLRTARLEAVERAPSAAPSWHEGARR